MAAPSLAPARRTLARTGRTAVPPALVAVAVLGLWYLVSYGLLDERRRFLLPPLHEVLRAGFVDPETRADLLGGLLETGKVALTGLVVAIVLGSLAAVAMSRARWVQRSLYPWAVVLQTIPVLALIPVIGFWFGFSFPSRVVVCVLIALFPIVTNTLFGLLSVTPGHRDLFRLRRATRRQTLLHLEIPAALPAVITGWRIAAGLSVIGAIVGDFYFQRGPAGIGRLINGYTQRVQSEELFAGVLLCSLLGLAVFWFFGALARVLVAPWHESGHDLEPD